MSQDLEKEFVNAGVQSPSEFEVASDEPATQSVKHRVAPAASPKSRVDSTVQTQDSASELKPLLDKNQKTLVITLESCDHGKQNAKELNSKSSKKLKNKKKGMEKNSLDLAAAKTTPDLERKKLEAELKATEQIAKIKQSVIEKRLELELASLQDPCNPNIRLLQKSPNLRDSDLKILESSLRKSENLMDQREQSYRNHLLPPSIPPGPQHPFVQAARSPFQLPFPPPIPPNQYPREYPKTRNLKNDCDFRIRSDFKNLKLGSISPGNSDSKYPRPLHRNIVLPERGRFMQTIEKPKYSSPSPQMGINPFKQPLEEIKYVQSPQMSVTEAYYTDRMPGGSVTLQQDLQEPGCSPGMADDPSISIWKILMAKVKRKLKRSPPRWR